MSAASNELRNSAIALREAAWREGVEPDGPLGVWVRSLERTLTAQSALAEKQEAGILGVVKDAKGVIDGQVEALKKALALAEQQNKRAETALRQSEVDREKLVNHTVDELTGQVTAKLNGALVLRQQRYDRQQRLGSAGLMTAIVLGLFFGGYALHAYLWRFETGSVERCLRQTVTGSDGASYCPLSAVKSDL